MDTEIQSALRAIGKGFQAGRFTTQGLLRALGVEKLYIVSGIFTGVFLSIEDLKKGVACFDQWYRKEEAEQINAWLINDNRTEEFEIVIGEARFWASPVQIGLAIIHIKTLDLKYPKQLLCCDNDSNTKLSPFMSATCPSCKEPICVGHFLTCECDAEGCICCFSIDVITDAIQCPECLEKSETKKIEETAE